jgi:TadE-like protein
MSRSVINATVVFLSSMQFSRRQATYRRKGAAAIEFALVSPLLILLIFSSLELGRAVMVRHMLEEAALAGARVATTDNATKQQVLDMVDDAMAKANVTGYSVVVNPDPPGQADLQTPVTVSVSVNYDQVKWMALSKYMGNKTLTGTCVLPVLDNDAARTKAKSKAKAKGKSKAKTKIKAKAKSKIKAKAKAKAKAKTKAKMKS